jgi:hypothetical protein
VTDGKPARRSAGMLGHPRARRGAPAIPTDPPAKPREMASPPLSAPAPRASRHPRPKVLMGEVAIPRGQQVGEYRDCFRAFMTTQKLRPSEWAKKANVPLGEIMAYLTGRQRFFSPGVAERLAQAAGVSSAAMFGQEQA